MSSKLLILVLSLLALSNAIIPFFSQRDLKSATVYFTYEPGTTYPPKNNLCVGYPIKDVSRLCVKCNISDNGSTLGYESLYTFRHVANFNVSVTFAVPPVGADDETINKYLEKSVALPTGQYIGQLNRYTFTNTNTENGVYILSSFIPGQFNTWPNDLVFAITLGFDFVARILNK